MKVLKLVFAVFITVFLLPLMMLLYRYIELNHPWATLDGYGITFFAWMFLTCMFSYIYFTIIIVKEIF